MRKVTNYIGVWGMLLFLFSCKHSLDAGSYVRYVQDKKNGLKKTIVVGDFQYDLQYKPGDYLVLMESSRDRTINIKKRRDDLKGLAWFNVSLRLTNGTVSPLRYNLLSKEEYDQRLDYFLNSAAHNIQMVYGITDTLRPISYLFENNYNLAPQETMVVGFELPAKDEYPKQNMQFIYTDEIFKTGIIKVMFNAKDMQSIPDLIY